MAVTADTLSPVEAHLLAQNTPTYAAYYNGKMSYALHGKSWNDYIREEYPNLNSGNTSENIFKAVIDLYAENLVPAPDELKGFAACLPPLLSRGECVVVVTAGGELHFPEHYEIMSDGKFSIAAIFTRNLELNTDNVTFVWSDGRSRLYSKPIPPDFSLATREGYAFVEERTDSTLFRFALDDKGFGPSLAALQDRVNHSIVDQTVIAEMHARPFWYLLKAMVPPKNPYLPGGLQGMEGGDELREEKEAKTGARLFTTSAEGPFGQLEPPSIADMQAYHDSIIDKVPLTTGIPQHYFKPGAGTPPTGVALMVLMKRFSNRIARIRADLEPTLELLAAELGVAKTKEVKPEVKKDEDGNVLPDEEQEESTYEYEFWNDDDDLLQEALDQHGINLSTMGFPFKYIASIIAPGVDMEEYEEEELASPIPGQATDMTAMGQTGTPATPGQVKAYEQNPGQRAKG